MSAHSPPTFMTIPLELRQKILIHANVFKVSMVEDIAFWIYHCYTIAIRDSPAKHLHMSHTYKRLRSISPQLAPETRFVFTEALKIFRLECSRILSMTLKMTAKFDYHHQRPEDFRRTSCHLILNGLPGAEMVEFSEEMTKEIGWNGYNHRRWLNSHTSR